MTTAGSGGGGEGGSLAAVAAPPAGVGRRGTTTAPPTAAVTAAAAAAAAATTAAAAHLPRQCSMVHHQGGSVQPPPLSHPKKVSDAGPARFAGKNRTPAASATVPETERVAAPQPQGRQATARDGGAWAGAVGGWARSHGGPRLFCALLRPLLVRHRQPYPREGAAGEQRISRAAPPAEWAKWGVRRVSQRASDMRHLPRGQERSGGGGLSGGRPPASMKDAQEVRGVGNPVGNPAARAARGRRWPRKSRPSVGAVRAWPGCHSRCIIPFAPPPPHPPLPSPRGSQAPTYEPRLG